MKIFLKYLETAICLFLILYGSIFLEIISITASFTASSLSSHIIEFSSVYHRSLLPKLLVDTTGTPDNKYSEDA